jgi:hypothetical protein
MAAPEYVPEDRRKVLRAYESPPRRLGSWRPERPGDLLGGQPRGTYLGNQGPDQGYLLALADRFKGKLTLTEGEHEDDALAGAVGIALKRASLFGRAPVIHDLTVALTIWGFLGTAPPELVRLRKPRFEEAANPLHYAEQRRIVDAVPEDVLRRSPAEIAEAHQRDWRSLLSQRLSSGASLG